LAVGSASALTRSTTEGGSKSDESPERRRTGRGGAGLRDKIQALANRLKERENTVVLVGGGDGAEKGADEGEEENVVSRKLTSASSSSRARG
jgi:hypothetical protein